MFSFLVGGILLAGVYAEAEGVRLTKDVEPNIGVQGRPNPVRHIARYSHHGPLFSDAVPPLRKGIKKNQALVFASVARTSQAPSRKPQGRPFPTFHCAAFTP